MQHSIAGRSRSSFLFTASIRGDPSEADPPTDPPCAVEWTRLELIPDGDVCVPLEGSSIHPGLQIDEKMWEDVRGSPSVLKVNRGLFFFFLLTDGEPEGGHVAYWRGEKKGWGAEEEPVEGVTPRAQCSIITSLVIIIVPHVVFHKPQWRIVRDAPKS